MSVVEPSHSPSPETYKYDAEKHILEISGKSITALDISRIQALNAPAVYHINIHDTAIADLPNLFNYPMLMTKLEHVTSLAVINSDLISIPVHFVGAFPALKILNLQNNQIATIPVELFDGVFLENLANLDLFNISNNQLTNIPEEFANIRYLTHINLGNNKLTTLPQSLAYYANLNRKITINLRDNYFREIPLFLLKPQKNVDKNLVDFINYINHPENMTERDQRLAHINANILVHPFVTSFDILQYLNAESFNMSHNAADYNVWDITIYPVHLFMDENPLPEIMYSIDQPYTSEDYDILVKYTMQSQTAARDQNEITKKYMSSVFRGHFNPVPGYNDSTRHASPTQLYTRPLPAQSPFARMNPGAVNEVYSFLKEPVPSVSRAAREEHSRLKSEGAIGGRRSRRHRRRCHTKRRHRCSSHKRRNRKSRRRM